jgi:hypothetical protein
MSQRPPATTLFFVIALGATFALQLPGGLAAHGLLPAALAPLAGLLPLRRRGVDLPRERR